MQKEDAETIGVLAMMALLFCHSVIFPIMWQRMEEGQECRTHLPVIEAKVYELRVMAEELVQNIPDLASQNAVLAYCAAVNRPEEPPVVVVTSSSDRTHSNTHIGSSSKKL